MIKLIVFDFDGVIADCKELHYQSLNKALEEIDPKFTISRDEHISIFDGLSTKKKLYLLSSLKGLPVDKIDEIYYQKQVYTQQMLNSHLQHDERLVEILSRLKKEGYMVYMASNAIRQTIENGLSLLGVLPFFDFILSNEDVKNQKPHPEIYLKSMVEAGVKPHETLIVEDSKHGREAAVLSGAFVCGVDNPLDLTYEKLDKSIKLATPAKVKWPGKDVTILIPMAGAGSRFKQQGYKLPKPLIDVNGKPMIQWVVENLNIDGNYVFVVQKEHYENYNLGSILPLIAPGCKIVQTEGLTEGAACTTLLAKEFINNDDHLLIANSDQFVEWDSNDFMYSILSNELDGGILSFRDSNPKWSFAKVDDLGFVTEVAEKKPISDIATVGIYYFNRGSEYVKFAEQMITKNIRVNNEFYVCPVYNEYIQAGKKIKTKDCKAMWGLGIPEDLQYFLDNYKGK
jgi:haloacid dehalogenase superfamily, subfamily IA, variant 3 with third motif having DD or ED